MEGEPELPPPPAKAQFLKPNPSPPISINPDSIILSRSFNTTSTCSSTTSSSSPSSPPDFVRQLQAACKRHRPLGMMQSNGIGPRRYVVRRREAAKDSNVCHHLIDDAKKSKEDVPPGDRLSVSIQQSKAIVSVSGDNQEGALINPPSEWGKDIGAQENFKSSVTQQDKPKHPITPGTNDAVTSLGTEPITAMVETQRRVHFSSGNIATTYGDDYRMATASNDLLSHMNSLALTEIEQDAGNHVDTSAAGNEDWQHHNIQNMEIDNIPKSDAGISSLLTRRAMVGQDQLHQLGNFLQSDLNNAITQSSAVGSCVTSTLMNLSSAPMVSSTTYSSQLQMDGTHLCRESTQEGEVQPDAVQQSISKNAGSVYQSVVTSQATTPPMPTEDKSSVPTMELQSSVPHDPKITEGSNKCNPVKGNANDVKSQPTSSEVPPSNVKLEHSKSDKPESGASGKPASSSRKRGYDPDLFFKVNGKLYQRLGKIGSGGSSEVHKVISSDCMIYALKKIKLKGRDYATAFGFCQEIEYLNRLKGKNNIIQLIDYEVTDRTLLQDVLNGSVSNKDGRVKGDGYIYMVLEYGEIDLAHMLAQKWKELDVSTSIIDENWLRFYWQQILLAVNIIHEKRIVHSDLKPANFLLVRGSLKLIDFGIAKAIMSDTTNIQRDSQVGTLSYMSPEAFMCNEKDAEGNIIKCGRSSDIWSLGCILYQMVYGKTPFSEYKTFWAKFKVITDPNHEILYEPLPNPWLLDIMKKCLVWDRNKRWKIPQLLQHPFLVPPVLPQLPNPSNNLPALCQLVAESSANDHKAWTLCSQLQAMLMDPKSAIQSVSSSLSREELRKLLCQVSNICFQLQELLASS